MERWGLGVAGPAACLDQPKCSLRWWGQTWGEVEADRHANLSHRSAEDWNNSAGKERKRCRWKDWTADGAVVVVGMKMMRSSHNLKELTI